MGSGLERTAVVASIALKEDERLSGRDKNRDERGGREWHSNLRASRSEAVLGNDRTGYSHGGL